MCSTQGRERGRRVEQYAPPTGGLAGSDRAGRGGAAQPRRGCAPLLASHPHALGLLAEARHRRVVARGSVAVAAQAARWCRDAEVAFEAAHHRIDPRGVRSLRFLAASVVLALLLAVCGAGVLALSWGLFWPDRIVLASAATLVGGVAAWRVSVKRGHAGAAHGFVYAGLGLCVALVVMHVLTAGGSLALRVGVAVALGVVVAAAMTAAVAVFDDAEGWRCYQLRQACGRAARHREDALNEAAHDEDAAGAAAAAWESLVAEECRLAHPGKAVSDTWLECCMDLARTAAIPQ